MARSDRILALAAIGSVLLHLVALSVTPRFELDRPAAEESAVPLEARIVARAQSPRVSAVSAAQPDTTRTRRAPAKARKPKAHLAPPAAPRWIVRPGDLGTVPPMPDGGFGEAQSQGNATQSSDAAAGELADSATGDRGDATQYPVHRARLVYDLFYAGGPAGVLTHTWSTDGRVYRAESVAEGVGLVKLFFSGRFVQRSTGRVGPEGLIPIEYTLQRGSAARSESARFDWHGGKLSLAWKDQHRVVDLPAGTQDALSILHQAYFMPPTVSAAPLGVATSRKLGHYIYEVVGEDLIETPLGILRTVHIRRADDDGMQLDIWLDRDRSLLPARILGVDRRGAEFEQMIREVAVDG